MEQSGFFDAEELVDGTYDREYVAEQWANYFKLFIGNGVFATPTSQLKVRADSGLRIKILEGWAWINGYWYHNDSDLFFNIPPNVTTGTVTHGVFVRFDSSNRAIAVNIGINRTTPNRIAPYYELKIAEISVGVGVTEITDANITDTRANRDVCGYVTGLINVIDSGDLFAQYQTIFNEFMTRSTVEQTAFETDFEANANAWQEDSQNNHAAWEEEFRSNSQSWRQDEETSHETWENNYRTAAENWYETIRDQLSTDAAVALQNQINDLKYFYVQDGTLFIPNTRASVNDGVLIVSTT